MILFELTVGFGDFVWGRREKGELFKN